MYISLFESGPLGYHDLLYSDVIHSSKSIVQHTQSKLTVTKQDLVRIASRQQFHAMMHPLHQSLLALHYLVFDVVYLWSQVHCNANYHDQVQSTYQPNNLYRMFLSMCHDMLKPKLIVGGLTSPMYQSNSLLCSITDLLGHQRKFLNLNYIRL